MKRWELLERLFAEVEQSNLDEGDLAEMRFRLKLTETCILREIYETGAIRDTIAEFKARQS